MRHAFGVILLFVAGSLQAALVDRGGGFIYDDVLDLTWTQNANIRGGGASWDDQMAWAASLSIYDSVRDVTWDDWRLPSMKISYSPSDVDPVDCAVVSELECRDNEYGYMYYQNGVTLASPGLFTGLGYVYWSDTYFGFPGEVPAVFSFDSGSQYGTGYDFDAPFNAWAVRDGDVGANVVPIPAAVWLFGSGLGLLAWFRRRQTA